MTCPETPDCQVLLFHHMRDIVKFDWGFEVTTTVQNRFIRRLVNCLIEKTRRQCSKLKRWC